MKKKRTKNGAGEGFDFSSYDRHSGWNGGVSYWIENPSGKRQTPGFHSWKLAGEIADSIRDFAYRVMEGPIEEDFSCGTMAYAGLLNGIETVIAYKTRGDDMNIWVKAGELTTQEKIDERIWQLIALGYSNDKELIERLIKYGYERVDIIGGIARLSAAYADWD